MAKAYRVNTNHLLSSVVQNNADAESLDTSGTVVTIVTAPIGKRSYRMLFQVVGSSPLGKIVECISKEAV